MENLHTKYGILGGTFLTAVVNITLHDLVFTILMSVIGAVVSFFVSYFLRSFFGRKKR